MSALAAQLALQGLATGAGLAVSAAGLLVTYRTTGVLNLAHGAVATLAAYLVWQAVDVWHVPVGVAVALTVLVLAPLLGVLLERLVFRDLARRGAGVGEQLVATLGLLVLVLAVVSLVWGELPKNRVPSLFPVGSVHLPGGYLLPGSSLGGLLLVVGTGALLSVVLTRTQLGTEVRAVVDRRDLAELAGVDTARVAALGWAAGTALSALTGVLLSTGKALQPYPIALYVLESLGVAAVARLTSLPVAVGAGLALGVAQQELLQVHLDGRAERVLQAVQTNLPVLALAVVVVVLPRLGHGRGAGGGAVDDDRRVALADPELGRRRVAPRTRYAVEALVGLALLSVPFLLPATDVATAQRVLALAVVFLSLTVLTGFAGQVSLGHAGYAGLGALLSLQFSDSVPLVVATLFAAVGTGLLGALTGLVAVGRRGLFLALTTFAVGTVLSQLVFEQPYFTADLPPAARPAGLSSQDAFYLYELLVLAVVGLLVRNLRRGRLGRALAALRDSPAGATASGLALPGLTLWVFAVSAALAGVGGALLVEAGRAFDVEQFSPLQASLPWFTAVLLAGAGSAPAAVVAAAGLVVADTVTGTQGAGFALAGLGVLLLGRRPGGLAGRLRALGGGLPEPPRWLRERLAQSTSGDALRAPARPAVPALTAQGLAARTRLGRR